MAEPIFEKSTGYAIIEWFEPKENGSPTRRYYSKKPIKVQLHPRERKVVRMYFRGNIPDWMKRFCTVHNFKCEQIEMKRQKEKGWLLARSKAWDTGNIPFSAPFFSAAFKQLMNHIPHMCEDILKKLKAGLEIIEINLRNYPNKFEDLGLYVRWEEIEKEECSLLLDESIIPDRPSDISDQEYADLIENDGQLKRLVLELTNLLPPPILSEEELLEDVSIEIEETSEGDFGFDFNESDEEFDGSEDNKQTDITEETQDDLFLEGFTINESNEEDTFDDFFEVEDEEVEEIDDFFEFDDPEEELPSINLFETEVEEDDNQEVSEDETIHENKIFVNDKSSFKDSEPLAELINEENKSFEQEIPQQKQVKKAEEIPKKRNKNEVKKKTEKEKKGIDSNKNNIIFAQKTNNKTGVIEGQMCLF